MVTVISVMRLIEPYFLFCNFITSSGMANFLGQEYCPLFHDRPPIASIILLRSSSGNNLGLLCMHALSGPIHINSWFNLKNEKANNFLEASNSSFPV